MTPEELGATARLAGQAFTGVASRVEGVHRAVANRAFRASGVAGKPARIVHNTVAGAVYGSLRVSGRCVGGAVGEVLGRVAPASAPAGRSSLGNQALAALNGFAGHRLVGGLSPLAIRMSARSEGRDVPLTPAGLGAAYPQASSKVAVFVHGLAETDNAWVFNEPDGSVGGFGPRLHADLGYTPVYLRYNSGRHVSDNGRALSTLLAQMADSWPVAPEELLLVGHSMGGLVIRSACHYGAVDTQPWIALLRDVVYLGSPHLGAPLARVAGLAGWALSRLPETRPFASLVNGSSDGVKDLRFGYLLDEDWAGCDPDHCRRNHRRDVPLLESASHYVISATVTADPTSPLATVVGDLLVMPASAHGGHRHRQRVAFPIENGRSLGGLTHLHLVNHPAVCAQITAFLDPTAMRP